MDTNKVKQLVMDMYSDHAKYPQLKLPKTQAELLLKLVKEVTK